MDIGRQTEDGQVRGLLRRLRCGDVAAFEALCADLEGPLFNYALKQVRDWNDAEDIAQESLLRLLTAARQGKLKTSPRGYAFSIAHNLAVDLNRRRDRVLVLNPPGSISAARAAEQALLRDQVQRALAELPENHRSALLLREYGELSYAEIAAALGASLDQVKVWIYRARRLLAQLLDKDGQYAGRQQQDKP